ncbi:MAG TPA: molybdenum cofactor biosynthesis protein MoaE [Planctomycetota bacterium]|jgi:molybdopterin synthase catalytic subunit|nr:molybdenum cofactor biosynthesis protein MoaE [Planctomycetota bacterium]
MNASFVLTRARIDVGALAPEVRTDEDGAVATFVGTARRTSQGRRVLRLEYEAYEPMVRAEMARIFADARDRFRVGEVRVVHRVGLVPIGEASIAIAVAAPHRADALGACRHLIDRIKETVPIWKKEVFEDGAAWGGDRS